MCPCDLVLGYFCINNISTLNWFPVVNFSSGMKPQISIVVPNQHIEVSTALNHMHTIIGCWYRAVQKRHIPNNRFGYILDLSAALDSVEKSPFLAYPEISHLVSNCSSRPDMEISSSFYTAFNCDDVILDACHVISIMTVLTHFQWERSSTVSIRPLIRRLLILRPTKIRQPAPRLGSITLRGGEWITDQEWRRLSLESTSQVGSMLRRGRAKFTNIPSTHIIVQRICMFSAALDDNNCVFYDGSSVRAQDLLGPVSSMSTIFRVFSCCNYTCYEFGK